MSNLIAGASLSAVAVTCCSRLRKRMANRGPSTLPRTQNTSVLSLQLPRRCRQRIAELYPQKHDKNALGCAADLLHAAAAAQPTDASVSVQALLVTAEYIDHVNTCGISICTVCASRSGKRASSMRSRTARHWPRV